MSSPFPSEINLGRHTGGWAKVHRSLLKHPAASDAESLGVFVWLILSANWVQGRAKFNGRLIDVLPGQIITGLREMAVRLDSTKSTINRRLQWLAECGSIVQEVKNRGRLITICNWEKYQGQEPVNGGGNGTELERSWNGVGTELENGRDLMEEGEEEKKQEVEPSPQRLEVAYRYEDEDLKGATWLQREIKIRNPNARRIDRANLEAWAHEIRVMRERDGLSHHQIAETALFALDDPFLSALVESPTSLRKKWDYFTAQMLRKTGGKF